MYEDVLAEVKAEGAKKAAEHGEVLPFSAIPYEQVTDTTAYTLWKRIDEKAPDLFVPPVYPDEPGNPVKRIYTKIVSKLVRCVTFPLTKRVTKTNQALKGCIDEMTVVIEGQQKTIRELEERVAQLEKKGAAK